MATIGGIGGPPVATLFAPATDPLAGSERALVWRGLVRAAADALAVRGGDPAWLDPIAEPLPGTGAVAALAGPEGTRWFDVAAVPAPSWLVGDVPGATDLARAAWSDRYAVLVLDLHHTRLLAVDAGDVDVVEVPGLPVRLEDAVPERERGQHLGRHGGAHVGGAGITATVHGQVDGDEARHRDVERFCRVVADAVLDWPGLPSLGPLVVAGTADLVSRFTGLAHKADRIAAVAPHGATRSDAEVAAAAFEALAPVRAAEVERVVDAFRTLHGSGLAVEEPDELAAAADAGRVETLLVPTTGAVDERADRTVLDALARGGRLVLVPAESRPRLGAVLRW